MILLICIYDSHYFIKGVNLICDNLYETKTRRQFSIIIVAETKAEDPMLRTVALNPLVPETFFPSNFEIELKISSHRLPTHRRGGHRKFFPWSRLFF